MDINSEPIIEVNQRRFLGTSQVIKRAEIEDNIRFIIN